MVTARSWQRKDASHYGVGDHDGPGCALLDQVLDLVQGRGRAVAVAGVGHDDPAPRLAHRDERDGQAVGAEVHADRVGVDGAGEGDVGQEPVLRVGLPEERQVELVADPAVCAVAADEVARRDLGLMAGGVRQGCVDTVCCLGEVEQLDALLDDAAEFLHPGPEQQFGVALREAEREAVPRAVVGQVEVEQPPGPRVHVHVPHSVATRR